MRSIILVISMAVLAGCAEKANGPRLVTYSQDRFYIRHVPVVTSRSDVDRLASDLCAVSGRVAELEDSRQYTWLDVRDATYRCVAPPDGGESV